jgi:hypothetical protein
VTAGYVQISTEQLRLAVQRVADKLLVSSEMAHRAHSGNPAFRRPSISSFEFDCPPRASHADMVKVGSSSRMRAAASRASRVTSEVSKS